MRTRERATSRSARSALMFHCENYGGTRSIGSSIDPTGITFHHFFLSRISRGYLWPSLDKDLAAAKKPRNPKQRRELCHQPPRRDWNSAFALLSGYGGLAEVYLHSGYSIMKSERIFARIGENVPVPEASLRCSFPKSSPPPPPRSNTLFSVILGTRKNISCFVDSVRPVRPSVDRPGAPIARNFGGPGAVQALIK